MMNNPKDSLSATLKQILNAMGLHVVALLHRHPPSPSLRDYQHHTLLGVGRRSKVSLSMTFGGILSTIANEQL